MSFDTDYRKISILYLISKVLSLCLVLFYFIEGATLSSSLPFNILENILRFICNRSPISWLHLTFQVWILWQLSTNPSLSTIASSLDIHFMFLLGSSVLSSNEVIHVFHCFFGHCFLKEFMHCLKVQIKILHTNLHPY